MIRKRNLFYLLLVFFSLSSGFVQSQELTTSSKKAKKFFESAENAYMLDDFYNAEILFKQAIEEDPVFFEAWVMLGELYEKQNLDTNAVLAYQKAVSINAEIYPAAFYFLGTIEFRNGWYDDALVNYTRYLDYPGGSKQGREEAQKNIPNCRFAIEAINHPVPFKPLNLGESVNTELNEYFPCLTADNQTLLFTRLLMDKNSFTGRQEDFYISSWKENSWTLAKNIGEPINTIYNEGAPALSADGNKIIFTACESVNGYGPNRSGYGRCDLFFSERIGSSWSVPENIGLPVSSRYWESQPCMSADGRSMYFVSNRNDNYDIYVTYLNDKEEWSVPEMLSENINTKGYEGSVFIHPDNQTLYFSSDGHVGMGGMDIFYSRKDSLGEWGTPVNLGYPINTHKDENSILIDASGDLAMFASDRKTGYGGLDLYSFELYKEARPQFVTYLKGVVFDAENKSKLKARFELTDLKTGKVAVTSYSNSGNGEFIVCIPTDQEYALTVSCNGYLFYSENFSVSGMNTTQDPFLKDIPLNKIKAGEKVVLKNIFFETDKYELKVASKVELGKLIELLTKNPTLKIEVGGYTDNVGTPQYNLELSLNRAKAVNDFLVEKGIDQVRILYKGYGETNPIDSNDTEEGRANNRRTEFKVI